MNIKIQNSSLIVETAINFQEYKEAKKLVPHALKVADDKGNTVFAIGDGEAAIKSYGVTFNATVRGCLAVRIDLPLGMTADEAKDKVVTANALGLAALATYEPVINSNIRQALAPIAAVINSITVEE